MTSSPAHRKCFFGRNTSGSGCSMFSFSTTPFSVHVYNFTKKKGKSGDNEEEGEKESWCHTHTHTHKHAHTHTNTHTGSYSVVIIGSQADSLWGQGSVLLPPSRHNFLLFNPHSFHQACLIARDHTHGFPFFFLFLFFPDSYFPLLVVCATFLFRWCAKCSLWCRKHTVPRHTTCRIVGFANAVAGSVGAFCQVLVG